MCERKRKIEARTRELGKHAFSNHFLFKAHLPGFAQFQPMAPMKAMKAMKARAKRWVPEWVWDELKARADRQKEILDPVNNSNEEYQSLSLKLDKDVEQRRLWSFQHTLRRMAWIFAHHRRDHFRMNMCRALHDEVKALVKSHAALG